MGPAVSCRDSFRVDRKYRSRTSTASRALRRNRLVFDLKSSKLSVPNEASIAALKGIAALLKTNPSARRVVIVVEADTPPVANASQPLSHCRGETVLYYLTTFGVDASILETVGLGTYCSVPALAPNETRVKLVVLEFEGKETSSTCGCPATFAHGVAARN